MKRHSSLSGKLNNVMFFLAGVLTVVIIGILAIGINTMAQNRNNKQQDYIASDDTENAGKKYKADKAVDTEAKESWEDDENTSESTLGGEKWAEGVISYKGHSYKYNTNQKIYLLMGIDNDGEVEIAKDSVSGGQSDAMFLLVADDENQKLRIVSINRNTMTDIAVCDEEGKSMGKMEAQICVQHGFGDGKKLSCTRTVEAVADMFYNLPISGYISFNLGAIKPINKAVDGVELEVLQNMKSKDGSVKLKKGQKLLLSDDEAYLYLRGRDTTKFDSATDRLRRQEQYINAYIMNIKNSGGVSRAKVEKLYQAMEAYMVSSVDFTKLVNELIEYDYTEDDMYTVPGIAKKGSDLEEYHIDQDAFYDLIFEVFYQEVD